MQKNKMPGIDPQIFWPALLVVIAVCIPMAMNPEGSSAVLNRMMGFMTGPLGWIYLWFGLGSVVFLLWLALGKYGKILLGDTGEKPEFSTFSWMAMLFCGGMGTSLLYWAIIEPIYYLQGPPFGIEAGSQQALEWASVYGPFHWGITPWAIYCLPVVPIAYNIYVRKQNKLRVSTASIGLIGEKNANGWMGKAIDIFVMFGLIGGVGTTMGLGTPMVSACISTIFGIPESMMMNVVIVIIWTCIFGTSVYFGLAKGIKILSDVNTYLALFLAAFVLIVGPTAFIFNNFTNALGLGFQNFIRMSLWTDPIAKGGFPQGWTIFFWAWWIAYAPFMGLFVARISRGRTIRNVIFGEIIAGAFGGYLYFAIFGSYAINIEMTGAVSMSALMADVGPAMAIATVLNSLPLNQIILPLFVILQFIFLATTLDSAAYVLSSIATADLSGEEEPARWNRFVWCGVLSGSALTLMIIGGLKPLQTSSIVAAGPLVIIMIMLVAAFMRDIKADYGAALSPVSPRTVVYELGKRVAQPADQRSVENKI